MEEVEVREVIVERSEPCIPNFGKRDKIRIEVENTEGKPDVTEQPSPNEPDSVEQADGFEIQITVENTEGKSESSDKPMPVEVELVETAPQNETEIEEQRHFKHCVEECSLLEQIRQ